MGKRSIARKIRKQEKINELFLKRLKEEGYIVEPAFEGSTFEYYIKGNKIYGFFNFHNDNYDEYYGWLNGVIAIDHKKCFCKASRCPCKLKLPITKYKIEYIIEQLKFWGTDEGYRISNEYECNKWVSEID